jgi:MFS family permease
VIGKLADIYGRIKTFKYCFIGGTFGFISYLIFPDYLKFLFIYVSIIGYGGFWNIICIYSPEIFPTKIRNITYSYSSFAGRLLPIMVPILTKIMPGIIDYTFLFSGILSGFIGMTLEETLGKKILDIIPEEIEESRNNFQMELLES